MRRRYIAVLGALASLPLLLAFDIGDSERLGATVKLSMAPASTTTTSQPTTTTTWPDITVETVPPAPAQKPSRARSTPREAPRSVELAPSAKGTQTAPPPTPPTAPSSYAFLHRDDAGMPVRWNPCQTIGYALNLEQAPADAAETVHGAFAQLAAASGLRFAYEGTTDRWGYDGQNHINVSWRTREQTGGAIPEGSVGAANPIRDGDTYRAAVVFFLPDTPTSTYAALHELGHAVGLAHPADGAQIMAGAQRGSYALGDREGLRWVGAERGCS